MGLRLTNLEPVHGFRCRNDRPEVLACRKRKRANRHRFSAMLSADVESYPNLGGRVCSASGQDKGWLSCTLEDMEALKAEAGA